MTTRSHLGLRKFKLLSSGRKCCSALAFTRAGGYCTTRSLYLLSDLVGQLGARWDVVGAEDPVSTSAHIHVGVITIGQVRGSGTRHGELVDSYSTLWHVYTQVREALVFVCFGLFFFFNEIKGAPCNRTRQQNQQ